MKTTWASRSCGIESLALRGIRALKEWFCSLAQRNNGILLKNAFILVYENNRVISASNIRSWLRKQCDILGWDKKVHKPYSLRIGRAEDLFHIGLPLLTIQDLGCWRSSCFMKYIRPTAQDNLILLKGKKRRCVVNQLYKNNLKFRAIGNVQKT